MAEPTEYDSTRTEVENYRWTGEEWKAERVNADGSIDVVSLQKPLEYLIVELINEVKKMNIHLEIITNEHIKEEDLI